MALIIITGHVLATSPPMRPRHPRHRRLAADAARRRRAGHALRDGRRSWFNWGFSLIFSAVLAREVARRVPGVDYRALAAASFLGLGSIWAQGLSGSAALQMATPGALQPQIRDIVADGGVVPGGIIPFSDTIFLWQSFVSVVGRDRRRHAGDVAGHAAGRPTRRPRATSASTSADASSSPSRHDPT